jgi:predicted flap endonuclease-1-like 5' DNA nuclease
MNTMVARIAPLLLLAACSQHQPQTSQVAAQAKLAAPMVPAKMVAGPVSRPKGWKGPLMIPIPKDRAQLKRLLAMGYTIHEDHLHAPGVTSCPKMSENPVQ